MHLADAFIQSDFSAFRLYIYCQYVFPGIEPTTLALLTQCSTTEPQEHAMCPSSVSALRHASVLVSFGDARQQLPSLHVHDVNRLVFRHAEELWGTQTRESHKRRASDDEVMKRDVNTDSVRRWRTALSCRTSDDVLMTTALCFLLQRRSTRIWRSTLYIHYTDSTSHLGCFWSSSRLHLFDQKYCKTVKYY